MLRYQDIRAVHIEITDKCNAACPMCPRNEQGAWTNPNLDNLDLSLADIQKIFPVDFIRQLDRIYFCGNYGDPIMAKELLEVLTFFRKIHPTLKLQIFTNGSARSKDWWSQLGRLLSKPGDFVRFSVDGLKDTNHLYRRNTTWESIVMAMKNYIGAGGIAVWDYLVFAHNQHQIEDAKLFAKALGFADFFVKYTGRSVADDKKTYIEKFPVYDKMGALEYLISPVTERDIHLQPLAEKPFANQIKPAERSELRTWRPVLTDGEHRAPYLKECVRCKVTDWKEIFVAADGSVLPCCWTGGTIRSFYKDEHIMQFRGLIHDYGLENLSAFHQPIHEIVNGPFFQTTIPKGWGQSGISGEQNLLCHKFCSKNNAFDKEFANRVDLSPIAKSNENVSVT